MNKKLIAAAIAAAVVAAPAAFAESTVYGLLHTSVDKNDTSAANTDNYSMTSRASRLGFKGSEDLGGGLKAIYQIEMQLNSDGGAAQAATAAGGLTGQRNTFVGLAGDWGTFVVGRHDTPAKMAFYAAGNEVLGDSVLDLNSGTAGVFTEVRANNAIAYVSPNFSGFTVAAAIVPGEETVAASGANAADGLADHYSIGAMYAGMGIKASVSYENLHEQALAGAGPNDMETFQAGGSYTFGAITVGGNYQDTDNFGGTNNRDYRAWGLSAKATFGNNAVMAIYTDSRAKNGGAAQVDTDGWGLGAEHAFSKRTKVYAAYATEDTKTAGAATTDADNFSLGMIHNF